MWTKEQIAGKLATDNIWLFRGVCAIYNYQTPTEQSVGETQENNGVGFNGADAFILSSFAVQINKFNATPVAQRRFNSPLSLKQIEMARKKMAKYAGQLAGIAAERQAAAERLAAPPVEVRRDVIANTELVLTEEEQYNAELRAV